jgi:hypothetical protein
MPSATDRCSMFTMLPTVRNVPPSIVTITHAMTKTPSSAA